MRKRLQDFIELPEGREDEIINLLKAHNGFTRVKRYKKSKYNSRPDVENIGWYKVCILDSNGFIAASTPEMRSEDKSIQIYNGILESVGHKSALEDLSDFFGDDDLDGFFGDDDGFFEDDDLDGFFGDEDDDLDLDGFFGDEDPEYRSLMQFDIGDIIGTEDGKRYEIMDFGKYKTIVREIPSGTQKKLHTESTICYLVE